MHPCQVPNCPPGLGFCPPASSRTLLDWVIAPCFAVPWPPKEEPPFTDGRFDALASRHLEGLRVREGGMVSSKSALEANDSLKDLVASRSKLGKVFRSKGPRHTPLQQGVNHLGLLHSEFQAMGGGRPIIYLRAEPLRHARMRRIRRAISSERSDFWRIMPPRYKNWAVCLYLWPAVSMTSGSVRVLCGLVFVGALPLSSFRIPRGLLLRRQSR